MGILKKNYANIILSFQKTKTTQNESWGLGSVLNANGHLNHNNSRFPDPNGDSLMTQLVKIRKVRVLAYHWRQVQQVTLLNIPAPHKAKRPHSLINKESVRCVTELFERLSFQPQALTQSVYQSRRAQAGLSHQTGTNKENVRWNCSLYSD